MLRWSGSTIDTLSLGEEARRALALSSGSDGFGRPVAVAPADSGTFWMLGSRRVLSEDEEARLTRAAPRPGIQTLDLFRRRSAHVRNEVFDGILARVARDGTVLSRTSFDGFPWGFLGGMQFYTFHEDQRSGLIQIRIWRFHEAC
jgi:hypothetical protein